MIYCIGIIYLTMATHLFISWLKLADDLRNLSEQQKVFSWITLIVAAVFWPLVIPIAYTKLVKAQTSKRLI
jgi:arginine exporter protein ArgO